jgi:hypothetical protein
LNFGFIVEQEWRKIMKENSGEGEEEEDALVIQL